MQQNKYIFFIEIGRHRFTKKHPCFNIQDIARISHQKLLLYVRKLWVTNSNIRLAVSYV